MPSPKPPSSEPFWMDQPNPYIRRDPATPVKWSLTWWISILLAIYRVIFLLSILTALIFLATKFAWLWILVVLAAAPLVVFFWARMVSPNFKETRQARAVRIQQLAKQKTGADYLGGALHTAGHPLLQANQPVVLGLKGTELSIYGYDSSNPIAILQVKDLQALDPVVFDEDHVPHLGVIDNSAQALQLSFPWRGKTCTCSFRSMHNVRAIEWYQAIQKARFAEEN